MLDQVKRVLQDREHASRLLIEQLQSYKNSDTVIVALPPGGIPVGNHLALSLQLPLEFMPIKRIKHPAHSDRSIGAVTANNVVLLEEFSNIPQHYIYHQIHQLRNQIISESKHFENSFPSHDLQNKTVIIADTFLFDTEGLSACIQAVKSKKAKKIVIATLLATSRAAFLMTDEEVEFHYLHMIMHNHIGAVLEFCNVELNDDTDSYLSAIAELNITQ